MGLDIMVYRNRSEVSTKSVTTTDEANKLYGVNKKLAQERLEKTFKRVLNRLRKAEKASDCKYNETYVSVLKTLSKYFSYPEFELGKVGVLYDYKTGKYHYEVKPLNVMEENMWHIISHTPNKYDAYFRKVNFIFEYFRNKMVDEWFSIITLEDVEDIIDKCEKVLKEKDEDVSRELLPTTGGFFFGSTDYDEWYYNDVKDCLKQMKKFRKLVEKDGRDGYIIFSW